jgi:archaemetzincin
MKYIVYLQKIGNVDSSILIRLKKNLQWLLKKYTIKIEIDQNIFPILKDEYIEEEKEYSGRLILERLENTVPPQKQIKILGLINEDIKTIRTKHLFGLTNLKCSCALISTIRLQVDNSDMAIFEQRILKVAVHELGHTFGLAHCNNECVMRLSKSLKDLDEKPKEFCFLCDLQMRQVIKSRW